MREYGKIGPAFWTGETGRKFRGDAEAQVVAAYLVTCPSATMTGLYYLPLPTLAHEVGMTLEGASKALRRVCKSGFAAYEGGHEVVFVPEMARFQIGESLKPGDKRILGIVKEVERFKKTRFYNEFYQRYKAPFALPEPSPFEGPCKPLRSQEQEQEQEQDLFFENKVPPDSDPGKLPGKAANKTQAATTLRWRAEAENVLAAVNAGRREIDPSLRGIKATHQSLAFIAARLEAGNTPLDCLHVVDVCKAECRQDKAQLRWFNTISPFRPDNFERKLQQPVNGMATSDWLREHNAKAAGRTQ